MDGRRVVWQDERFGPADIFLANLDTGEIRNLTESEQWEALPDISGDIVVWRDGYAGLGIHGVDLGSNAVFTVTSGHSDISRPRVSGTVVVWADKRAGGDDWNIYGYDLAARKEFVIDNAPGRQQDPQIDGNYVVWWDYKEQVFLFDLSTKTTKTIYTAGGARLPVVSASDNLVVWMQYTNGKWDLNAYDIASGARRPLVTAPGDQELPSLDSGLLVYQTRKSYNRVDIEMFVLANGAAFALTGDSAMHGNPAAGDGIAVWEDMRNHQRDLYRFDWEDVVPPVVTDPLIAPEALQIGPRPQNQLLLQWADAGSDEVGFAIERSAGFAAAAWQEIAVLPAGTTAYTDTALAPAATYWYRVRAFNDKGASAYSNESFSSAISTVPSLDEQYMMVLINAARAAPEAFGYPGYSPAPPLAFNTYLGYSARAHSQSILNAEAQFGHCDFVNRCPGDRAVEAGYPVSNCAENLTQGSTGPEFMESANQGFMDSEGHRANIMEPGYTEFAVGHTTTNQTSPTMPWPGQVTEVFCGRAGVERPTIPMGAVVPYSVTHAGESEVFTYTVNFYAADGSTPAVAQVVIDGVAHPLKLSTGRPWHGTYRFVTTLPLRSEHTYFFSFVYGNGLTARWPQDGSVHLPAVAPNVYLPHLYLPHLTK